jgi:hypothetical protein
MMKMRKRRRAMSKMNRGERFGWKTAKESGDV